MRKPDYIRKIPASRIQYLLNDSFTVNRAAGAVNGTAAEPANFVIAYHDGTNAKLDKCVAGTYTTVITGVSAYSANAKIVVRSIGTSYYLWYNNAYIGSGTISDAAIRAATRHGVFSTYSGNTIDNVCIYATGTGNEYGYLDKFI